MFEYPLSSTLHTMVTDITVRILESNNDELIDKLLEDKSIFIDRILEVFEEESSSAEYIPHLKKIVETIEENEKSQSTSTFTLI